MARFLERHASNAILAAILTSVLAFAGSIVSVYLSYHFATVAQDRQARIEQITKFDAASAQLIEAAGSFINAINGKQDLEPSRLKVRTAVANQISQTEVLRNLFDGDISKIVGEYQDALSEFNKVAEKTETVTEMRPWAESFGRVLDLKAALS